VPCAPGISSGVGRPVEPVELERLGHHGDAVGRHAGGHEGFAGGRRRHPDLVERVAPGDPVGGHAVGLGGGPPHADASRDVGVEEAADGVLHRRVDVGEIRAGQVDQGPPALGVDAVAAVPEVRLETDARALLDQAAQQGAAARRIARRIRDRSPPDQVHRATRSRAGRAGRARGRRRPRRPRSRSAPPRGRDRRGPGRRPRRDRRPPPASGRAATRRSARPAADPGRACCRPADGETPRPCRRGDREGRRLVHQLLVAAPVGGDHRHAAGGGLEHRHAGTLPARGQHEGVGRAVEVGHLLEGDGLEHELQVGDALGVVAERLQVTDGLVDDAALARGAVATVGDDGQGGPARRGRTPPPRPAAARPSPCASPTRRSTGS
jgi:hypothetical protein